RTPLATVEAHLEAVEDGVRSLDEDTLTVIRLSTRRLGRLAEDIAAVSQAEEGTLDIHRQKVEAGSLATAATAGAQDRFTAKGVRLDATLNTNASVLADPERIGQVLSNLLENALRHTPPGASVTLSCRREGRWVEFVVVDSGEGIAPEHLSHVFDRFYRADTARDRNRGGSGIGLSISKALVEAHGGTLTALSRGPGLGSTFTVRLSPADGSQPEQRAER
ncbi:MAG: ATP-binding protein, partial [Marmoricola sp.]